eukprot:jgi/Chlat1/1246/Chrsp115S08653
MASVVDDMRLLSGKGLTATAAEIRNFTVGEMPGPSRFVKPRSVTFTQDGMKRRWDMVLSHPSVAIVLYHTGLDAVILVRQFRPAVYASALRAASSATTDNDDIVSSDVSLPLSVGFAYELCAGIVDKADRSLAEIAKEEVLEECGFDVPATAFKKLTSFVSSVGISGPRQTLFFAKIDDTMRIADGGGGVDGEAIDVVALPVSAIDRFVFDADLPKSSGCMWGVTWLKMHLGR